MLETISRIQALVVLPACILFNSQSLTKFVSKTFVEAILFASSVFHDIFLKLNVGAKNIYFYYADVPVV